MNSISLKLQGMSCASCAISIEKEVSKLSGVISSQVNYAFELGTFKVESRDIEIEIKAKIVEL